METDLQSFSGKPAQLEGYLLHCQSIEKNIDRRYLTNRFNFSVLVAIVAGYGYVNSGETTMDQQAADSLSIVLLLVSLLVSIVWVFQILRFREVSRVKHEVAIELEEILGIKNVSLEAQRLQSASAFFEYTAIELLFPIAVLGLAFSQLIF